MMLCSFLPCSSMNQPHGHMCPLPLQPPSHPRPTPRSSRSPEPGSLSAQRFPPSVLHVLMDMHQSQSQFIPPPGHHGAPSRAPYLHSASHRLSYMWSCICADPSPSSSPPSPSPAVSTGPSLCLRLSPAVVQVNLSKLAFKTGFVHLGPPWPGEWTLWTR